MPWIQLRVSTNEEKAEQVSDMLMGWGAQAVSFVDAQDTPIYEPMPGEVIYWTNTVVVGLFDAEHPMDKVVKQLEQVSFFKDGVDYKLEQLEDKDWEREWMDNFHPIKFGTRLWVCPSWRDIPDPTAVNVMLDPGLAFGTGTHPTTALCMQWLDATIEPQQTVVDFGCGSGILGIAALKLELAGLSVLTLIHKPLWRLKRMQSVIVLLDKLNSTYLKISLVYKPMWWSLTSWQARCANWRR